MLKKFFMLGAIIYSFPSYVHAMSAFPAYEDSRFVVTDFQLFSNAPRAFQGINFKDAKVLHYAGKAVVATVDGLPLIFMVCQYCSQSKAILGSDQTCSTGAGACGDDRENKVIARLFIENEQYSGSMDIALIEWSLGDTPDQFVTRAYRYENAATPALRSINFINSIVLSKEGLLIALTKNGLPIALKSCRRCQVIKGSTMPSEDKICLESSCPVETFAVHLTLENSQYTADLDAGFIDRLAVPLDQVGQYLPSST